MATTSTPSEASHQEFFSDEFEAIVASNINSPVAGPVDWTNYNLLIDRPEPEADGQTDEAHTDLQAPQASGEDVLETFVIDDYTHTDEAHADPQAPKAPSEAVAQEPEEGRTSERPRRRRRRT
jgi:hypothetical protein